MLDPEPPESIIEAYSKAALEMSKDYIELTRIQSLAWFAFHEALLNQTPMSVIIVNFKIK